MLVRSLPFSSMHVNVPPVKWLKQHAVVPRASVAKREAVGGRAVAMAEIEGKGREEVMRTVGGEVWRVEM